MKFHKGYVIPVLLLLSQQSLVPSQAAETAPEIVDVPPVSEVAPAIVVNETVADVQIETEMIDNSEVSDFSDNLGTDSITSEVYPNEFTELESTLGEAIYAQVNELRELNGLNTLKINSQISKAATELVRKEPTSETINTPIRNPHRKDQAFAKEAGYTNGVFAANHISREHKLSEIQHKGINSIASDLVN